MDSSGFLSVAQRDALQRIASKLVQDGQLVQIQPLTGGVSAQVFLLEIVPTEGKTSKLVLRVHGAVDREQNPNVTRDEFKLLAVLHRHGLLVPEPLYLAQADEIFDEPALIIRYIDGKPDFSPPNLSETIQQAAEQLARIHQTIRALPSIDFVRSQASRVNELLNQPYEDRRAKRIQNTLSTPVSSGNPEVVLHGDYWFGNLLWREGHLVGVIDWEDAAIGDPLADLANSRLEVLWAFGEAAMHDFTKLYLRASGFAAAHLAYWDLWAALRPMGKIETWGLDPAQEKAMHEQHQWFIMQAFQNIEKR